MYLNTPQPAAPRPAHNTGHSRQPQSKESILCSLYCMAIGQILEGIVRPRDALNYLIKTEGILMYPEVVKGLLLYLTLPCTTASAERSFSKLKIIKSYLRTAMRELQWRSRYQQIESWCLHQGHLERRQVAH